MDNAARQDAPFGQLLRSWRTTRRLSQLDLSLASDVSQRHLSFLESGRGRPSRQMVLQLGGALNIPLRDQNALLQAAGFAPMFARSQLDTSPMDPVREALELMLTHHEPLPAIVIDRDWNLLMTNRSMTNLLSLAGDVEELWERTCGKAPRNIMRLLFHPRGLRPLIANWEVAAPTILTRLHREQAAAPSEGLKALLCQLQGDSSIPLRWHYPDPSRALAPVLPLEIAAFGQQLKLFSMISTFGTPQDVTTDELRLETFFPADSASNLLMQGLGANGATSQD